ncbi:hypothetical protein EXIGLDRAFT_846628 [Exidia glandulosa HHB12029]|uniref:DUF6533 domain-containing protein n=1 Tax=Exidia glandulosa HHB12029 TaxID=1314781 RepID=A0A165ARR7_EXIGL|nr:hypothetical protein EXIGLDRAFT_846628 [Exidia glandulosa HHB12029]
MSLTAGTPTPSGYLQIACTVWFLYDWILTLDDEVEYIWRRKWSFAKGLFIIIRISTILPLAFEAVLDTVLENLSVQRCDTAHAVLATMTAAVVFETDIVLQFRVWIMFQKARRVLWCNAALFVINVFCALLMFLLFLNGGAFEPAPSWIQGACYGFREEVLGATLVVPLCFEIYLTLLAVYKLVRDHQVYAHLKGPSLLSTLVRDSVIYFVLLVIVMGLNIILWDKTTVTPGGSSVNLMQAAGGIGGARIILSTLQAASTPPGTTIGNGEALSSIRFAAYSVGERSIRTHGTHERDHRDQYSKRLRSSTTCDLVTTAHGHILDSRSLP